MLNKWLQLNKLKSLYQRMDSRADNYFNQATSWADDYYLTVLTSRNRYRFAFILMILLCCCLSLCITYLVPSQHIEPFLVHHYASGNVLVEPGNHADLPLSQAQTESELVRYVINRESYDHYSYEKQYSLTYLLSSDEVARKFKQEQDVSDPKSFITTYGSKLSRLIHIQSIVFLDNDALSVGNHQHVNLAEVNFTASTSDQYSLEKKEGSYVATISWIYGSMPKDPEKRWQNWSGFQVVSYRVSQRSI